ncbi:MAG: hypothetical protein ACD_10C00014G0003 [uncultured bacterium]|nr:MAG: hypothetical protein ACD_10C00014G0003 [uncultured bacterium]
MLAPGHGQGQDKGIGIDAAAKMQQAADGDGQDEQVEQEEVKRKEPDRLVQMGLVNVLNDGDLELARQEHDGQHADEGQ